MSPKKRWKYASAEEAKEAQRRQSKELYKKYKEEGRTKYKSSKLEGLPNVLYKRVQNNRDAYEQATMPKKCKCGIWIISYFSFCQRCRRIPLLRDWEVDQATKVKFFKQHREEATPGILAVNNMLLQSFLMGKLEVDTIIKYYLSPPDEEGEYDKD